MGLSGAGTCSAHSRDLCCGYVLVVVLVVLVVVVVVLLELHSGSDNLSRSTGVLSGGLGKEGSVREL